MAINVILFGSTGMIGQAVLRECLDSPVVASVLVINRRASAKPHEKVREIIHHNFYDFTSLEAEFARYDTCFFSLGISAVGLTEEKYHQVTYDLTVCVAESLLRVSKEFVFCYISGAGTDSTEKGRFMWARVKGKLENKLLSMPFRRVYMLRPGYIQPMKGIKSRTGWYNLVYTVFSPVYFLLKPLKGLVTNTSALGKAMINIAVHGYGKSVLEVRDINRAAGLKSP